jgi:hypothetical protein
LSPGSRHRRHCSGSPLAADTIRALHIVGLLLARTQVPVHGANLLVHAIAGLTGTAVEVVPA